MLLERPPKEKETPEWLAKAVNRKPINPDEIYAPKTNICNNAAEEEEDGQKHSFTEEEFLAGNVPLLRGSSEPNPNLPPRGKPSKPVNEQTMCSSQKIVYCSANPPRTKF